MVLVKGAGGMEDEKLGKGKGVIGRSDFDLCQKILPERYLLTSG